MSKINPSFFEEIDIIRGPVLASTSPFRRQQLKQLGIAFDTANPEVDETPLKNEAARVLVSRLAEAKALAVAQAFPHRVVIGADQIAWFKGQILGKPGNTDACEAQLRQFSGQQVRFFTALTVCALGGRSLWRHLDTTFVDFRTLSNQEIARYVAAEQPVNCAGGFKIEGAGISLFASVRSDDPSALIGLPLIATARALRHYGIALP